MTPRSLALASLSLALLACGDSAAPTPSADSPAAASFTTRPRTLPQNTALPDLHLGATGLPVLTYVQDSDSSSALYRLDLTDAGALPQRLAEGDDWFVNWADVPRAASFGDDREVAHVLAATGDGTYDYRVDYLLRGGDGGWALPARLHDDTGDGEHGFVTWLPVGDSVLAVWLDGSAAAHAPSATAAMQLHARYLRADGSLAPERTLDARVCDCCPTDAAVGSRGPVVVYRDRSDDGEIRDIYRALPASDLPPAPIHVDGWEIAGCPVNGPAVAARGDTVAVAWYTGADERPRVGLVWSLDGGANFGAPQWLDEAAPLGRVDLALAPDGTARVVYLGAAVGTRAALHVASVLVDGQVDDVVVDSVASARRSGVPRLTFDAAGRPVLAYTVIDAEDATRVRVVRGGA